MLKTAFQIKQILFYLVHPCRNCGLPLCLDCSKIGSPKYHGMECKLFEKSAKFTTEPVITYKSAKSIYSYLTALRLLLKAETCPELLSLNDKLEERADTIISFFNIAHVVKPIHKVLNLEQRFSLDQIQTACGILDTNCYEVKWDRGVARGLYLQIAIINHDCAPNCRKFFDAQRNMHVVACKNLQPGEEISLSYTNPLLSTPLRQVS
jgi:hypothetical protein